MLTQSAYDFSPLLRMMFMGVVLAVGPLMWVLLRQRGTSIQQRLRALTLLTLFLTFDLVLFGAFTRLTDSGLGCPDWPGCYGHSSPLGAAAQIDQAQNMLPTGPVTHSKAWIEMIHRYLATSVGVLILVQTIMTWHIRRRFGATGEVGQIINPWWSTFTLIWVCIQGAFGAFTVTMKLFPAIVTLHLLGGFMLLALLVVQSVLFTEADRRLQQQFELKQNLRIFLWVCFAIVFIQSALGGWVSTNYAVLACSEFPLCQGRWWPNMDFEHGFQLWRALGYTAAGELISFPALTAVHMVHRIMAGLVIGALLLFAWQLHALPSWHKPARWIVGLIAFQFITGLSNVVLGWPLISAVAHTGGAAALIGVMAWIATRSTTVEIFEKQTT